MNEPQAELSTPWTKKLVWKVSKYTWPITSKAAWFIYEKVSHCDSPEYFKAHPKLVRWTGGLRTFAWSHVCGHGLGFSLRTGNIYWRLWKRETLGE